LPLHIEELLFLNLLTGWEYRLGQLEEKQTEKWNVGIGFSIVTTHLLILLCLCLKFLSGNKMTSTILGQHHPIVLVN